jgi:hypothetical protein
MGPDEFKKWLGILLATTFAPGFRSRDMWSVDDTGFFAPPKIGERHGMSRDRWMSIKGALTFRDPAPTPDRWECRWLIDQFNLWMEDAIYPGYKLVVDESMFEWRGRGDYDVRGLPHVSKVARKPKGVGLELKNILDCASGVMLRYEMLEGKAAMAAKKYCAPGVNASTATTKRLVEPWMGKGRIIVGDSWFASVQTAVALFECGCYFTGMVKTAHREFPASFIQKLAFGADAKRGDTVSLTATKQGVKLIAHGWNEPGKKDKPKKALISTCGVTIPVEADQRTRWILNPITAEMEAKILEVPKTALLQEYFQGAKGIDVFNHGRQGGLRIEALRTKDCWFRVFQCMVGTIETSAFNAMRYFEPGCKDLEHGTFTERLASALTGFDEKDEEDAPGPSKRKRRPSSRPQSGGQVKHLILMLKNTAHKKKLIKEGANRGTRVQGHNRCKECGKCAYFYCRSCSGVGGTAFHSLCGPATGRNCISAHIERALLGEDEDEE